MYLGYKPLKAIWIASHTASILSVASLFLASPLDYAASAATIVQSVFLTSLFLRCDLRSSGEDELEILKSNMAQDPKSDNTE